MIASRLTHLAAAVGAALALAVEAPAQTDRATAFVDVTVLPMDGRGTLPRQTVVVRGDRIVAVGPTASTAVPSGAAR